MAEITETLTGLQLEARIRAAQKKTSEAPRPVGVLPVYAFVQDCFGQMSQRDIQYVIHQAWVNATAEFVVATIDDTEDADLNMIRFWVRPVTATILNPCPNQVSS